jgi:hypothetical protein
MKQVPAATSVAACFMLAYSHPWRRMRCVLQKRRLTSTSLHVVTSAVRTWSPTNCREPRNVKNCISMYDGSSRIQMQPCCHFINIACLLNCLQVPKCRKFRSSQELLYHTTFAPVRTYQNYELTYRAEPFLRSRQLCSPSITSCHFILLWSKYSPQRPMSIFVP